MWRSEKAGSSPGALKEKAREALLGNYGMLFGAAFLYLMIQLALYEASGIVSISPTENLLGMPLSLLMGILSSVITTMMQAGMAFIALNIARKGHAVLRDLFLGFRYHSGRLVCISLMLTAVNTICSLPVAYLAANYILYGVHFSFLGLPMSNLNFSLSLIGSAVFSILLYIAAGSLFSMALYLYIDHQEYSAIQCMTKSVSLMLGNRIRFFLLILSFIGYGVLVLLSFGIGIIWVGPYLNVSQAEFYIERSGRTTPY